MPEWRNWQTQRTQNPSKRELRKGSTPFSGTIRARRPTAITLVSLLAVFAAATRADAAPKDFLAPFLSYPTGGGPVGLAAGDLNGDGRVDLLAAPSAERRLTPLYGQSDGGFLRGPSIDSADGPVSVAIGDLDGDDRQDIVAACVYDNVVAIVRQSLDGGYERLPNLDVMAPVGIDLVDLDGDTALDIVAITSPFLAFPGGLSLWAGDGAGGFGSRRPIPTSGTGHPVGFEVAAADADLFPDLAVITEEPQELQILRNNGNGTFTPGTPLAIVGVPIALTTGDWNGDSRLDVAVFVERFELGNIIHRVVVGTGRETGGFDLRPELFGLAYAADIGTSDVNGDGDLDLVSVGIGAQVYLGNGDGTFGFPRPFETGNQARQVLLRDLNEDDLVDITVAASASDAICLLPGHGDGTFGAPSMFTLPQPQGVAIGDWNGDSRLDLALPSPVNDVVCVHLGNGDGTFGPQRTFPVGTDPTAIASGDLNGDGKLDLVCVTFDASGAGVLSVLLGDGQGVFAAPEDAPLPGPALHLVLGDWDEDGTLDAAAVCWTADWPDDGAIAVLRGVGDGSFEAAVPYAVGPLPMGIGAAELNGDGHLDLVASFRQARDDQQGGTTRWLGDGDGGFTDRHDQLTGREPRDVAFADFDGDGALDLVVAHSHFGVPEPGHVAVSRNRGDGVFEPVTARGAGGETYGLALADFDRDGRMDVAAANAAAFSVSIWRGTGGGMLGDRMDFGAGPGASMLGGGDFDGDERPDLVTGNRLSSSATVLLCRIVPTPVAGFDLAAVPDARGVRLAWRLAAATLAGVQGVHVERALEGPHGPWERRTALPLDPALDGEFLDTTVDANVAAWYRLALLEPGGTTLLGPVAYQPAALASDLVLTAPVVSRTGPVLFRYRIGTAVGLESARLDVIDVRGRIVRALGPLGHGDHTLAWDRRDGRGARVARGAYFVRLSAGGRSQSARLVLVAP